MTADTTRRPDPAAHLPAKRPFVLLAAALLAAASLVAHPARAQGSADSCTVRGSAVLPPDVEIYDRPAGGQAIARFTGAPSLVAASAFGAPTSRARVETGTGTGSFRITGYVPQKELPLFSARNIPVHPGHVWIAAHRPIRVVGAGAGKLHVEQTLEAPIAQTFRAAAPCSVVTFDRGTPAGFTPPGGARGYIVRKPEIPLHAAAGGSRLLTLKKAAHAPGILLWSLDRRGDWVHVQYNGDVILDAWARAAELDALPPGETMDPLPAPSLHRSVPRLQLQSSTRVIRVLEPTEIRAAASEDAPVIGQVEPGTDTFVLDVVAGWASVLPKSLHVAPAGTRQFWVRATKIGFD